MPQAARYKGRQKTGALRCLSPLRGSRAVGDGPGAARYALAPGYLLIAPSALILALQVLIVAEALVSRAVLSAPSALILALQVLIVAEALVSRAVLSAPSALILALQVLIVAEALVSRAVLSAPSALILALQVLIVAEALVSRAGSVRPSALIVALQVLIAPQARSPANWISQTRTMRCECECRAGCRRSPALRSTRRRVHSRPTLPTRPQLSTLKPVHPGRSEKPCRRPPPETRNTCRSRRANGLA